MRIGFIGAGKVASAFGRYLHNHGINIGGYYDHHEDKTARACKNTGSRACASDTEVAQSSDIVLITTRDDQIQSAVEALSRKKVLNENHLVGHMSGAHPSLILSAAADSGAAIFSLHPLQAFAREEKAVADLAHTWFSLDGTDPRIDRIADLLDRIGNRYFRILPEHKRLYHLSACILSNYMVTLIHAGMTALEHSGIPPAEGFTAMLPLIRGTIANVAQMGPEKALTGPIARGDAETIRYHLKALDERQLQDLKHFYCHMGLKTLEVAIHGVLKEKSKIDTLRRMFTSERKD
jgi:predicted short-subunit dehydrogenase-like oxidoreductase (DUF2520 family)